MLSLCFICLGNICRSPMAEAIMRQKIKENGWEEKLTVASRGTDDWDEGKPPYPSTRQVLDHHHIPYDGIVATMLKPEDKDNYDLFIVMEKSNQDEVEAVIGKNNKTRRLLSYTESDGDIVDPWYTGNFNRSYAEITRGIEGLIQTLKKEGRL